MTTVKVHAEIDRDGKLSLELPVGLAPGWAEVLVVIQPEGGNGHGDASTARVARSGLFTGKSAQSLDVDAALKEMNEAWKSKLSGQQ